MKALPWAKPRHELLLLALVTFAALSVVQVVSTQDISHFCLTRALPHAHLTIQPCADDTIDQSVYNGGYYTNKAPGMSVLAVPAALAVRLPSALEWPPKGNLQLWAVRVLTSGVAFLVCCFLAGRIAEGIAPGAGGLVLVTLGLGTLMAAFAATGFDHVLTAGFGFGAFVLAWSRRHALAGLAAGIAYAVEYQAAIVLLVVAVYLFALYGLRALARYAAGAVPGVALSAAYSWAVFGRPWRNPHNYLAHTFPGVDESSGVLGVSFPTWHGIRLVFVGDRGLLVTAPVLAIAAVGLWLLWRRGLRAEALVCAAVTAAFVVGETGYGDPYGGISAGPRYLIPALPFLALGLAPAFTRWRVVTAVLAGISIVAVMTLTLTWAELGSRHYRSSVWGEIVRAAGGGISSRLYDELAKNVIVWAGTDRLLPAFLVCAAAATAFVVALRAR